MIRSLLAIASLCSVATAEVRSGRATAELISATTGYQPGQPLQLGIRMKIDQGWHGYWINPGEGGMETTVEWTLPEGWKAGELLHPSPIHFGGALPGFGYSDEVILPVTLTPPATAKGPATIKASVSWLTCSDQACVPGDAELSLALEERLGASNDADAIRASLAKVPQPLTGASLKVSLVDKEVILMIELPETTDASKSHAYPATKGVMDIAKPISLTKTGNTWQAKAPLHEYADGLPEALEVVVADGSITSPVILRWESGK